MTLEDRTLAMLRKRGPLTDTLACRAATCFDSLDRRRALHRLVARGLVVFTKAAGDRTYKWRVCATPRHDVPAVFADGLLMAYVLRRQCIAQLPMSALTAHTIEDAQDVACILAMLSGSPAERRHAFRVLAQAQALIGAVVATQRSAS